MSRALVGFIILLFALWIVLTILQQASPEGP